jgi:hypothetical protein
MPTRLARLLLGLAICVLSVATTGAQQPPMRFDRVLLLEETSETSANVSFGDVNGDGSLDVMLAKGRHWPLVDQVLINDVKGKFRATPLGAADRTYAGLLVDHSRVRDCDRRWRQRWRHGHRGGTFRRPQRPLLRKSPLNP